MVFYSMQARPQRDDKKREDGHILEIEGVKQKATKKGNPKPGSKWYAGAWRTPEGIEKRRAYDRARRKTPEQLVKERERYKNKTPAQKARERERHRGYYHADSKRQNQIRNENRRKTKEHTNARQRKWYSDNREDQLQKIRERRKRNNPTSGLKQSIYDFKAGRIDFNELDRRYGEAFVRLNEIDEQSRNKQRVSED